MAPREFEPRREQDSGARIYEAVALLSAMAIFLGPGVILLSAGSAFLAGTIGYAGIVVFTGSIAARYGFAGNGKPVIVLVRAVAVSAIVASPFYTVFLLFL